MSLPGIEQNRAFAQQCFNGGNLAAAEVICRNILDRPRAPPIAASGPPRAMWVNSPASF